MQQGLLYISVLLVLQHFPLYKGHNHWLLLLLADCFWFTGHLQNCCTNHMNVSYRNQFFERNLHYFVRYDLRQDLI